MRLVNIEYPDLIIDFPENVFNVLVSESRQCFSELIYELVNQCAGHDGSFVLSDDSKILNLKNAIELIIDPFRLDFANRRIVNKLHQELTQIIQDSLFESFGELNSIAINLLDSAVADVPYPISYDINTDIAGLLKLYNVKVDDFGENVSERLCSYMKVMSKLCGVKLFVIANLGTFVDNEELELIYKTLDYEKINVLLLENRERDWLKQESVLIIDKRREW